MFVEQVPMKMLCISSAFENKIMEEPKKIILFTFSLALAYNGISIMVF